MAETDLDTVTRELAAVQRQLLDLPDDAFAARHELLKRQDQLRQQAARFRQDWDEDRSDEDLLAELAALRTQLAAIETDRIDLVSQSGGGTNAGPGADGWGGVGLNQGIEAAAGMSSIRARIGRIKGVLADRGVAVPDSN